jgi:CheY-like chemotaxis protein
MGLAIIHGIVKSYGGWVSLNSRPGQGTVFQVLLPVMTGGLVEMKPEETVRFGNERILYIDDEPLLAEMGKSMLERLGYQVTVQTGSLEALTIFQNQPDKFDLVITDQTMPGMTGSDLARRILQIRPFMPIILCTGYSSIITEEKSKSLGIKGFAMKPLAMKSIAALIREVLAGDRLLSVKSNQ